MTLQNEKFEELIADQLHRQLAPQRGRAAAAFKAQIAAEAAEAAQLAAQRAALERAAAARARQIAGGSPSQKSWARKEVTGKSLLFWTATPSLIAAALALAVTLHFTGTGSTSTNPIHPDTGTLAGRANVTGDSRGISLVAVDANSNNHPSLMPERTGVLIIQDPNIQTVSQPLYQPQPAQWTDPVDHYYRLADKP